MGYEKRKATDNELDEMKSLVEDVMKSGVFGISTGPYPPGSFGDIEEVIELCKVVGKYSGIYTTHLRSQGLRLFESLQEAIDIGFKSGVKVDISHLKAQDSENWGKVVRAIEIIKEAKANGLEIICDVYPYTAASNPLISEFPSWIYEGGSNKMVERLKDLDIREKLTKEMPKEQDELWSLIYISGVKYDKNRIYIGKSIKEIANDRKKSSYDTACDLLIENDGDVHVIVICMSEQDVKHVLSSDIAAIGGDGGVFKTEGYTGHPRAFGTFPRVIGHYIRDLKLISLEEGVRKMTSLPANFMGINDRGAIAEGYYADIAIFDYDEIMDKATYEEPGLYPEGIKFVIVNGKIQLDNGLFKKISVGKILRRGVQSDVL